MCDLEHGPEHLMLFLALVARVLGVLEAVLEFEECILDVVEALRRSLTILAGPSNSWHDLSWYPEMSKYPFRAFGGNVVAIRT